MKICAIHGTYAPNFSGAAIHFHRHAKEIVCKGHSVMVITPKFASLKENEELDGVKVFRFPICNRSSRLKKISFMISSSIALIKYRRTYDILHLYSYDKFYFLPLLAAKLLRKKTFFQITLIGQEPKAEDDLIGKLGLLFLDRIVGISAPIIERIKIGPAKKLPCYQLGIGIDPQSFFPVDKHKQLELRDHLHLPKNKRIICFVGTIMERKGVDVLFEAFRIVAKTNKDVMLLLVGPDEITADKTLNAKPYQDFIGNIKHKGIEWGLEHSIMFIGRTDKVPEYLQASDIFVFPSRLEGLGVVILEAMAVGLPCIVSSLDGISKGIIDNGLNGIILEDLDPSVYASEISRLLENKGVSSAMGHAAVDKIKSNFTMQKVVDDYINFYASF